MFYNKLFHHPERLAQLSVIIAIAVILSVGVGTSALAINFDGSGSAQSGVNIARGEGVPTTLMGDGGAISTIINTMLYIVGALSVIMLIFGGIRYVVSGGNQTAVTAAKNTILYAIVGLLISLFAYAIINFVLDSLISGGSGGTNL